jgi:N-acetylglucosamine malate deacetylase 1
MSKDKDRNKIALGFLSHPDDAEFTCTGTLALLHQKGWEINIATMTPGDCGSAVMGPEEISKIRRVEGANSAAVLKGKFYCAETRDCFVAVDKPTIMKVVEIIRKVRPAIVFTHSPSDYFLDHEVTSTLIRHAVFIASVPNLKTESSPTTFVPHLFYVDAMEGKDLFGNPINPSIMVDISSVIDTKERMLCCHASQRDWLLKQHGIDEYVHLMKAMGEKRGKQIGTAYGEGFRQHLGHAYPQDNILATELGGLVRKV